MEQFGGKVRKKDLEKLEQSKNWKNGKFENLIETKMDLSLGKLPKLLRDNIKGKSKRFPQSNLPVLPFNLEKFENTSREPTFVWYGHSVCLLRIDGKNLLIDPMFGADAAPIAPFSSKRFSANSLELIDNLPKIDAVLITHDHYDHLDLDSIKKLRPIVKTWFVGLGMSRHLEKWKIPESQITEFDWWEAVEFKNIQITYTPSRHFSGRGAFDRAKSLWGGWVFKTNTHSLYWSGDSGYGSHFNDIGEKLGPFDFGFMECGQYNENWRAIHMSPEESVQAAIDAGVKKAIAVHWAGFSLALHHWKEPIERFKKEAKVLGLKISTPQLGEAMAISEGSNELWWTAIN